MNTTTTNATAETLHIIDKTDSEGRRILTSFCNGVKHGIEYIYYPNSFIAQFMFSYKGGVLDGKALEFREDGEIQKIKTYKAGLLDGKYIIFYTENRIEVRHYEAGNLSDQIVGKKTLRKGGIHGKK